MRPAEYTDEQILEAAHKLIETGRRVTGFALRERCGGGNPTRLKQVWDEHVALKSAAANEPVIDLPIEVAEEIARVSKALTDQLMALATNLNDKAVKAAERRVAEVVRSAGDQREQAERELADAAATVEELDTALDQARGERDALEQAVAAAQQRGQAQAIEIAQLNERLVAQARQLATTQERHQAELAGAKARGDQLAAELEHSRQQSAEAIEGLRLELEQAVEAAHQHSQVQAIEIAELKANASAAEASFAEARKRMATETHRCGEMLTAAQSTRDTALKETREAREALARQSGKLEALEAQNRELVGAIKAGRKA